MRTQDVPGSPVSGHDHSGPVDISGRCLGVRGHERVFTGHDLADAVCHGKPPFPLPPVAD